MKCCECPCSSTTWYLEGDYDWECIAGREDEMNEDEDGCEISEEEANKIAERAEESRIKFYEDFLDWLDSEEDTDGTC